MAAAKAPKVETVAKASRALAPAYAESKNLVNQQISGLDAKYDSQRAAINAERGQGFNAINNQATRRGGSFSGIPIDEQATYLSTKYLPGMQMADYQQNQEGLNFKSQLADINKEQRLGALSRVDQQKGALNAWNLQKMQIQARAKEAAIQRKFTASQSALDRSFRASQSASSAGLTTKKAGSVIDSIVGGHRGRDGNISPTDYRKLSAEALRKGVDPDTYSVLMQKYINQSHRQDYTLG